MYTEKKIKPRKKFNKAVTISVRLEEETYELLKELAAIESLNGSRIVSVLDLIRQSIDYVYLDNERMRECFRMTRYRRNKWLKSI